MLVDSKRVGPPSSTTLTRRVLRFKSATRHQEQEWEAANDPLSNIAKDLFADLLAEESGSDYVFANPDTDRPYTNVGKVFAAACREAGIQDLTFHDFAAHICFAIARSRRRCNYQKDLLGHSIVEISDDYTHSYAESRSL